MSEYTVVMRRCDITGEEAPADSGKIETVPFGFDGVDYDIDLVPAQAAALREAFAEYIAHGRRTGRMARPRAASSSATTTTTTKAPARASSSRSSRPSSRPSTRLDPEQARAIRRWAKEVGYEVGVRGRIPESIAEHYRQAGGRTAGVTARS